jgi:prophage antirepressor-like protein
MEFTMSADTDRIATFTHTFHGAPLMTVTWQGRPAWIARHIGARLGYAQDGKRFPNTILGEWKDEFIEGKDYALLSGADLAAFKALPGAEDLSPHTHSRLLLLFESGLHLALIKTRKTLGRDLRRFLAREVLPQLVRTGAYRPDRQPDGEPAHAHPPGALVLLSVARRPAPSLAERRESRLEHQADVRDRWVDLCDRRLQVQTLHRTIDRLEGTPGVSADEAATLQITAAEIALDADLSALKPAQERWVSPGQIARRWGVHPDKVRRIITLVALRGDPLFSRRVARRVRRGPNGVERLVFSWAYNAAAEAVIEEMLDAQGFEPKGRPVTQPMNGAPDAEAMDARGPKDAA